MSITTDEFISNFHSLSGTTIGERRKNLFLLLNKTKELDYTKLDFASIQPKIPLEDRFKVEVLIYFRRISDLADLLKCENPILIHRILKVSWFLQEIIKNFTGEAFVTSVLPFVSFNVKVKMVNKLSLILKDTQQADLFYFAINQKYGLYLASKLLPACSSELIIDCIRCNRIKLTPRQLLIIIKKYPEITEDILEQLSTSKNMKNIGQEYKQVFLFIAKRKDVQFLKLYEQYKLPFHLGWRLTDKFVQINQEEVVNSPNTYLEFLHKKQLIKSLKQNVPKFFINLFPKSVEQFQNLYDSIFLLLKYVPHKMHNIKLLLSTFEQVYGSQLWDHSDFVTPQLLAMLSPDERQERIKIEYKPENISEDEWDCYLKPEVSIPRLKKRISLSSDIKARADLMELLVKTCKLNNDLAALAEMCKYVINQHRNDHMSVRLAFLRSLKKNFPLEKLSEQHWLYINELIKIFALNDEYFFHKSDFLEGYIHCRILNNLPVIEQLTDLVKSECETLNIIKTKPQYEKQCLLGFAEVISQVFTEKNLRTWHVKLLTAFMDWNKRNQNDQIDFGAFISAIESLKETFNVEGYVYNAGAVVAYCLKQNIDLETMSSLLVAYLSKQEYCYNLEVILVEWLIKYKPVLVLQNIEVLTQAMLKMPNVNKSFFWRHCQNYSHLEIASKATSICLNICRKEEDSDSYHLQLKNAILALSYLMSANEFINFVGPYYPLKLHVELKTDQDKKTYKVQKAIGASLKNVKPLPQILESILNFCKGDYLRVIQPSLYSVSGNLNEDKLLPFFSQLLGRSVSVRKHALHLAFRTLDKEQVCKILNRFMETEKNASIRKFVFKCSFNFFVKNPTDYSWNLVKFNLNAVDTSDKEAIGVLMQVDKIPRQYLDQYMLFSWEIVSKLVDGEIISELYKPLLLNSLTSDTIQLLQVKFCKNVIANYLFKCSGALDYFQAEVQAFTCKFLIHCKPETEQEEVLKLIFSLLKDYIVATWNNVDNRSAGRTCTTNILKILCQEFLDGKCVNEEILKKFINLWDDFLKPHQAFEEYLQLQFTLIYVEKLSLHEIGQKLAALCDSLAKSYGPIIIGPFYNMIKLYYTYYITSQEEGLEENKYVLIESFVSRVGSVACLLLVVLLLNDNYPTLHETKLKYNRIIEILESKHDKNIQMYLDKHFRSISN